jgi:hypothetical protein
MQVADAALVEISCELALGKTRPARRSHGAQVDQQFDLGRFQLAQHGIGPGPFIADGEEQRFSFRRHHFFNRSIIARAAAGARIFPSWMK